MPSYLDEVARRSRLAMAPPPPGSFNFIATATGADRSGSVLSQSAPVLNLIGSGIPIGVVGQAPASAPAYYNKVRNLFGTRIVGYWPLWEPNGTFSNDISGRAHNGTYTGVTLAQPGIGDGETAPSFDGATSFNNIYSVGLNNDFSNSEMTLACWCKVSAAGVWTDATARRIFRLSADANNEVYVAKDSGNNAVKFTYTAGSTIKSATSALSVTTYFHIAITVSKAADQVKNYVAGAQVGATLTGLGVWAGALSSSNAVVGAQNTGPTSVWSGILAHAVLLSGAATAAEVAIMATVP